MTTLERQGLLPSCSLETCRFGLSDGHGSLASLCWLTMRLAICATQTTTFCRFAAFSVCSAAPATNNRESASLDVSSSSRCILASQAVTQHYLVSKYGLQKAKGCGLCKVQISCLATHDGTCSGLHHAADVTTNIERSPVSQEACHGCVLCFCAWALEALWVLMPPSETQRWH